MQTQALVVQQAGAGFSLEDIELDDLRPDECLIQLVATGICHTDLKSSSGGSIVKFPVVLGHEGTSSICLKPIYFRSRNREKGGVRSKAGGGRR